MKKSFPSHPRRAQTTIEYILLFVIGAIIVFVGFNTLVPRSGQISGEYFNKVSDVIMGEQGAACGDGLCNGSETCSTCPGDCGACISCGDHTCNGTENCSTCPGDCGVCPFCGDTICNNTETCSTCPFDCGACITCPNGACESAIGEDCVSCPDDCGVCPSSCGNGSCESGPIYGTNAETPQNCCVDCGSCGDCVCCGWAQGGMEQWSGSFCSDDCGYCGDGVPYTGSCPGIPSEDPATCCQDFPIVCGDGQCCRVSGVATGADYNCPWDCPETGYCGDGFCNTNPGAPGGAESSVNCCKDCHGTPACGDGVCCSDIGETSGSCLCDCHCPNSTCDKVAPAGCTSWVPEDGSPLSCPQDCPSVWIQMTYWNGGTLIGTYTTWAYRTGACSGAPYTSYDCWSRVYADGVFVTIGCCSGWRAHWPGAGCFGASGTQTRFIRFIARDGGPTGPILIDHSAAPHGFNAGMNNGC